jgi:hypothetical protein
VDANGLSRGLITNWNSSISLINCFYVHFGLCMSFKCEELNLEVSILNLYGPYLHKHEFWNIFSILKWLRTIS